ncbi:MAG: bifunctional UDP-N-acetylglucosamine diphosphorylase/glucosamine-1-phosphate N-acetyltransferase GlmU [Fimbriimonas sp.]
MPNKPVAGIILAAGKGTRMKSDLPKCAHPVCGLPMVELIARAMKEARVERPIVVIGHGGEQIQKLLGDGYDYVWQREQHGTGHAAQLAMESLRDFVGSVLISAGDTPLVDSSVFRELIASHEASCATATVATAIIDDATGYGRMVRDETGNVARIVEHKDASHDEQKIREVNAAIYCIDAQALNDHLPNLKNTNSQGEYYLTDIVAAISQAGQGVNGCIFADHAILLGVNDRWQLANADRELRRRILKRHALNGVTLLDIDTIVIGPDVQIGQDTVLEASTYLLGKTTVGRNCRIGPCTRLLDTTVGDDTTMTFSHADAAEVGSNVWVGPYAHLRPKTRMADNTKVGNFVELKNTSLGKGAKVNHLSYVGDASVGEETNVGAGTITCNYDGFTKSRTDIGAYAFIGSNSTLVAPLRIGDGAMTAAGSVINKDVPAEAGAFGRARQENKPEWAAQWRKQKSTSRSNNEASQE